MLQRWGLLGYILIASSSHLWSWFPEILAPSKFYCHSELLHCGLKNGQKEFTLLDWCIFSVYFEKSDTFGYHLQPSINAIYCQKSATWQQSTSMSVSVLEYSRPVEARASISMSLSNLCRLHVSDAIYCQMSAT